MEKEISKADASNNRLDCLRKMIEKTLTPIHPGRRYGELQEAISSLTTAENPLQFMEATHKISQELKTIFETDIETLARNRASYQSAVESLGWIAIQNKDKSLARTVKALLEIVEK